ncbi:MAG TPA: hypothetical protein VEA61_13615 [Allosphingosinicella sp.]|nr:hypothetical protein [Allosphingosinicella sp.]
MIGLFLAALVQAPAAPVSIPPGRKPGEWCRGIHMPNGKGGVNLLWTTIRGPEDKLTEIGGRMKALGARVSTEGARIGPGEIRVAYQDDLDVRAIGRLLNQIDAGEFGPVTTEDFAMALDTLPANKCIRFVAKP